MSSEDIYLVDYKKFKQNHSSKETNSYNSNKVLHNSDLRNKLNNKSNKINPKKTQLVNESKELEWQKRARIKNELEMHEQNRKDLEWRKTHNNKINTKEIQQSKDFDLYKEYVQWDFINNYLYDKCEKLMYVGGKAKQELTNTLQRWFIYINEDFNNVPKYEYYSILPNIELDHYAAQFLRAAIIEKNFVTEQEADDKVKKILQMISRSHNDVVPHNITEPLHVEYDYERCIIVVNKFQSPEVPRVNLLVKKGGIIASARMLLRYEAFGNGSYQWGDPKEVHKVLYDNFHVRYEGFASPVNSRFIEYPNTYFCSLFPDTDSPFGSLGNFFHVDMNEHIGGWSVNPPFLNDLMDNVADRIIEVLDRGCPCYFFCTFPFWDDDEGWNKLNNSRHLYRRFDLRAHHFVVQDAYGNKFEPRMAMNLFVMGDLPPECAKLTELGNILIFNNQDSMPESCPW